jgi:type 1 fimbria pilin
VAVGEAIPGSTHTHTVKGHCDASDAGKPITACYLGSGEEVPGMPGVFHSSVDGIGIELLNEAGQPVRGKAAHCDSRSTPLGYVSNDGSGSFSATFAMRLIKTASTLGKQSFRARDASWGLAVYPDQRLGGLNIARYGGNLAVQATTCSVDPKSLLVNLGDFPLTKFIQVGSYTSWSNFYLTATCTDAVKMNASITSANGYTPIKDGQDALNLTPGNNNATGVAVQISVGNVAMRYDYPIPFGTDTVPNQPFTMLFRARYYQVSDQVTAGKANTIATIDIEYQ